jgi:FkbH-like protein
MQSEKDAVKCVVWDLDNTLWRGILLEDGDVSLMPGVAETLRELDRRGILLSIASRNDEAAAIARLKHFELDSYFLFPQIGWSAKSQAIGRVAERLNIGIGTIAFVDDDPFERDEVSHVHPAVRCISAADVPSLLDRGDMRPRFVTSESARRRLMYRADLARNEVEQAFEGPSEAFMASLGMVFTIAEAGADDLERAEELTVRTNQLNATGYTYSYEQLDAFRCSADHLLLVAGLEDRFGSSGTIGLALVEVGTAWTIKLLLMSCRVMARGVGAILISELKRLARERNVALRAEFVPTPVNRMMYVTYKFASFRECGIREGVTLLEADLSQPSPPPSYVEVRWRGANSRLA